MKTLTTTCSVCKSGCCCGGVGDGGRGGAVDGNGVDGDFAAATLGTLENSFGRAFGVMCEFLCVEEE